MTCHCTPGAHQREVAVYPDADTVILWMVACDECDEGKAKLAKSRAYYADQNRKDATPGTLSQIRAGLDRDLRRGSGVRWRIDPGPLDRYAPSRRAKFEEEQQP